MSKIYEIHPIAAALPEMTEVEFNDLREDIKKRGCIVPVVIYEDKILDGRHRYRACRETGQLFYEEFYTDDDPAGYVLALNVKRRNLTVSQRAMVADALANMKQGRPENKAANLPVKSVISQGAAAKAAGVSERTVRTAHTVAARATPEVVAAVRSGKMTVSAASKTLPKKPEPPPTPPEKDDDFETACDRILEVLGKAHADAVRKGVVVVKDLAYFVSLTPGKMKEVAELVLVSRWSAKSAVRFIDKPIDGQTKLEDLMSHCIRGKGTFKCQVGAFHFTVTK